MKARKFIRALPVVLALSAGAGELRVRDAVELEWATKNGCSYQLQSSADLEEWFDLDHPVEGDGELKTRFVSVQTGQGRFFRLSVSSRPPAGELVSRTACKLDLSGEDGSGEDCLEFDYDGVGTLTLKHVNAAFNCCPDAVGGSIDVQDGVITIVEEEICTMPCDCLCLYDLDYVIRFLPPGVYRMEVTEPYAGNRDDEPLSFRMDLAGTAAGRFCVPRTRYPWGL